MFMTIKKNSTLFILAVALLSFQPMAYAATATTEDSIMDDSLRDISVVIGAGAVGAVLGLSTLSFVDSPSDHLKNIAVGGAVGIVIGVGVVIFSQATRSTSAIAVGQLEIPMNAAKFATLTRQEFSADRIAKNYLKVPSMGYNFSF
jgi:NhaP-type Na+/H+ or K+/H+ antiporter